MVDFYRCFLGTSTTLLDHCQMTSPFCPAVVWQSGKNHMTPISTVTYICSFKNRICRKLPVFIENNSTISLQNNTSVSITSCWKKELTVYSVHQFLSLFRFLVPGWRLGWIVINDRHDSFTEVRKSQHFSLRDFICMKHWYTWVKPEALYRSKYFVIYRILQGPNFR